MHKRLQSLLLVIPLTFYVMCRPAIAQLVSASNIEKDINLIVTPFDPRSGTVKPSCVHTITQLKFTNTHKTDPVTITGLDAYPIENDNQQIFTSQFQERVLVVQPLSSILLPITFFPRMPPSWEINNHDTNNEQAYIQGSEPQYSPKGLSRAAAADLAELIGADMMGSNLHNDHHVAKTQVVVHTSRGALDVHVNITAIKGNPFNVPHTITFYSNGYVSGGAPMGNLHLVHDYHAVNSRSEFQFDLYMDNPYHNSGLILNDVYLSRPDLVQLTYSHDGISRFNNCGVSYEDAKYCDTPKAHDLSGPPYISAGVKKAYMGTLVVDPHHLKKALKNGEGMFLGFLQIVTSADVLSLAIEYVNSVSLGMNLQLLGDAFPSIKDAFPSIKESLVEDIESKPLILNIGNSSEIYNVSSRNSKKDLSHCDPNTRNIENSTMMQYPKPKYYEDTKVHAPSNKISAFPSILDFGLLAEKNSQQILTISVSNHGDAPIRLMRSKIIIDKTHGEHRLFEQDEDNEMMSSSKGNLNDENAIYTKFHFEDGSKSTVIKPGETADDLSFVSVESLLESVENLSVPIIYRGTVLLYFGPADKRYNDWRISLLHNTLASQNNILEIPFIARILYGHIEYNISDIYFPIEAKSMSHPDKGADRIGMGKSCSEGFDRTIHIKNMFPISLRILGMEIRDGFLDSDSSTTDTCQRYFEIRDFEGSDRNSKFSHLSTAKSGDFWGGITLRYRYRNLTSSYRHTIVEPHECQLVIGTDLSTNFHIPLNIFSGKVKPEIMESMVHDECRDVHANVKYGLECLKSVQKSRSIDILQSSDELQESEVDEVQRASNLHNTSSPEKDIFDFVEERFLSYVDTPNDIILEHKYVEPIMVSLGSLSSDSVESFFIKIKNHNPETIHVSAVVSAIEGMEVRLARTSANVVDYVDAIRDIQGHTSSLNDMFKEYPSEVGALRSFLGTMSYRDDISMSMTASKDLQHLYHKHAKIRVHRNKEDTTRNNHITEEGMNIQPPTYINKLQSNSTQCYVSHINDASLIAIKDQSALHHAFKLKKITRPQSNWSIPPGGIANIELLVRSPPSEAFHNNDVSDVVTTGILLKSSSGQVMPIVASYRVLSGQLRISSSSEEEEEEEEVSNKSNHFVDTVSILGPKQAITHYVGSEFIIENSFSTDVLLREIKSCKTVFNINLQQNSSIDSNITDAHAVIAKGGYIQATMYSTVECVSPSNGTYPSFYDCALAHLERSEVLLSYDCRRLSKNLSDDNDLVPFVDVDLARSAAVKSVKNVVSYLDEKYNVMSEQGSTNQYRLSEEVSKLFKKSSSEWNVLSKIDFNVLFGNVRAKFDLLDDSIETPKYPSSNVSRTISMSLKNTYFRTSLEIPQLYNSGSSMNTLNFGVTRVSEISKLFVPVKNPTGYPIRIRLSVLESDENHDTKSNSAMFFVQHKAGVKHSWWTGGSYFIPDNYGNLLLSRHNVTISTTGGSSLSLLNPSLHASSAFMHGCSGRRCGSTMQPSADQSQRNDLHYSTPIGASSATNSKLLGRLYNTDGTIKRYESRDDFATSLLPPFALGSKSIKELIIPPFGSVDLGPVYFRPPSRNQFSSSLLLENSLTGIEKIDVIGKGGWENIVFFEGNDTSKDGSDIETRFNKPALMFTRSKNIDYIPIVKTVVVYNLGDTVIEFEGVHFGEATFVEQVNGNNISKNNDEEEKCEMRGFKLLDCRDTYNSLDGFTLGPSEMKSFRIMHTLDCSFRSMFVSLIFEIRRDETNPSMQKKNTELLLGHDFMSTEVDLCLHLTNALTNEDTYMKLPFYQALWSILPLVISALILSDIIYTAIQRKKLSKMFKDTVRTVSIPGMGNSAKTGFKNWSSAFRCLYRAEPNSSDLVNLGKQQTRQILLNRLRKEDVILPQCILPNGAFCRDRQILLGPSSENSVNSTASPTISRRSSATIKKTLSESIFSCYQLYDKCHRFKAPSLQLPCGFDWNEAERRGILSHCVQRSSSSRSVIPKDKPVSSSTVRVTETNREVCRGGNTRANVDTKSIRVKESHTQTNDIEPIEDPTYSHLSIGSSANAEKSLDKTDNVNTAHNTPQENEERNTEDVLDAAPRVTDRKEKKSEKSSVIDVSKIVERSNSDSLTKKNVTHMQSRTKHKVDMKAEILDDKKTIESSVERRVKCTGRKPQDANAKNKTNKRRPSVVCSKTNKGKKKENISLAIVENSNLPSTDVRKCLALKPNESSQSKELNPDHEMTSLPSETALVMSLQSSQHHSPPREFNDLSQIVSQTTKKYSPIGSRRDKDAPVPGFASKSNETHEEDSLSCESHSSSSQLSHQQQHLVTKHARDNERIRPPPGFSNIDKLKVSTIAENSTSSESLQESGGLSDLTMSQNALFSTLLGSNIEEHTSTDIPTKLSENILNEGPDEKNQMNDQDEHRFASFGQDLNVMNFFSFLDEGVHADRANDESKTTRVEENCNYNSIPLFGATNSSVQANPWSDTGKPRALAYGIEVEQESNKDVGDIHNRVQLLTPSMILGQNNESLDLNKDEEEQGKEVFDYSVFARLLEGE